MKTTLCFLGRAHFPFFPDRPTSVGSRPTTAQRPICTGPPPLFSHGTPPATATPGSVPLSGPFFPPHTTAIGPHSPPPRCRVALPHSPAEPPPSNPHRAALKGGRCITAAPFPLFFFLTRRGHPYAPPSMPPIRVPPPEHTAAPELEPCRCQLRVSGELTPHTSFLRPKWSNTYPFTSPCCRCTPEPSLTTREPSLIAGAPPPLRIPITQSGFCRPSSPRSLGESPPP
jgi:hypothetical protein